MMLNAMYILVPIATATTKYIPVPHLVVRVRGESVGEPSAQVARAPCVLTIGMEPTTASVMDATAEPFLRCRQGTCSDNQRRVQHISPAVRNVVYSSAGRGDLIPLTPNLPSKIMCFVRVTVHA